MKNEQLELLRAIKKDLQQLLQLLSAWKGSDGDLIQSFTKQTIETINKKMYEAKKIDISNSIKEELDIALDKIEFSVSQYKREIKCD